jgi:hypothetical protein
MKKIKLEPPNDKDLKLLMTCLVALIIPFESEALSSTTATQAGKRQTDPLFFPSRSFQVA